MRTLSVLAALIVLMSPNVVRAQAMSMDDAPIAWGERDERHTTVCAKRWHAIVIRDIRTRAVDMGLGADEQVKQESKAIFAGKADCFTAQIAYTPVEHADVILNARTWVQLVERDGPVACFDGLRCRWTIQDQQFVESRIVIDGKAHPDTVYVATPRHVQPARIVETPPR